MVDNLRKSIGLGIARLHFRKHKAEQVLFTHSISDARNALLVMPFQQLDLPPIASVIELLRNKFQEKHITVITPMHSVELMRLLPQGRFVKVDPWEVSAFYLPRGEMMQRMPRTEYDLAIDLNLDFVLPSGYICRESNARIRVGFAGKRADLFYNFLVQTRPDRGGREAYERLASCLAMF